MRVFLFIGLFILVSCSQDGSSVVDELPLVNNEFGSNHYFDSLASLGAEYGFQTVVPRGDFDIVLSNSRANSVTATVLCYVNCVGYITYNSTTTPLMTFRSGMPQKVELQNLLPNQNYGYQFFYKKETSASFETSKEFHFSTQKSEGVVTSFAIIADSHIDLNSDTAVYQMTLGAIAQSGCDFLVDMGDTFMVDKYGQQDYKKSHGQFLAQRYFLGALCHSLPFYFVQGNHDGEAGAKRAEMTAWSKQIRESYFPNPVSENYFSWESGDALLVVLDPFTYTSQQGGRDPWQRTLGLEQYQWLERTLSNSSKRYKFVFIHNLVGGIDADGLGRGGSEAAPYWEWGGQNLEFTREFAQQRPGWPEPIHNLLKRYGVQVVFHGHDHLYAKQEYDGVIYQCVQQPGLLRYDKLTYGDDYGYKSGVLLYNPGYIKVTVSPTSALIESLSTKNELLDSYTL